MEEDRSRAMRGALPQRRPFEEMDGRGIYGGTRVPGGDGVIGGNGVGVGVGGGERGRGETAMPNPTEPGFFLPGLQGGAGGGLPRIPLLRTPDMRVHGINTAARSPPQIAAHGRENHNPLSLRNRPISMIGEVPPLSLRMPGRRRLSKAASGSDSKRKDLAITRIEKDLTQLAKAHPQGCSLWLPISLEAHLFFVEGPEESPYAGGVFFIEMVFPLESGDAYPYSPPKVRFRSRIYHCNVDLDGILQISVLQKWTPTCTVLRILEALRKVLLEPELDNALMLSLAAEYRQNKDAYWRQAADWTVRFAS